jgi:hypothetical protein
LLLNALSAVGKNSYPIQIPALFHGKLSGVSEIAIGKIFPKVTVVTYRPKRLDCRGNE